MKRQSVVLLVLVAALSVFATGSLAQSSNNCTSSSSFWLGDHIPPGWSCGTGQGPFMLLCTGPSVCGAASWCPTCNKDGAIASHPINLTNGNTYIEQNDVTLPGLGGGIKLNRTWSSIWPSSQVISPSGMFGLNWRSTYEEKVFSGTVGMQYARGDGSFWIFSLAGNVLAPTNETAVLVSGPTYWTITFQNGEQRQFDNTSGSLIAIIDRNGNTTSLTHDVINRLTTVTDAAGRHLYFGYSGSSTLVSTVTSDVSLSLAYAYDGSGRLTQVTKPDLTTITFQYNTNGLISAVLDSQGKTLESHTYDSHGRGLTSSRANGVEAVTVAYPQ
jgi:YD repeat-containing protein